MDFPRTLIPWKSAPPLRAALFFVLIGEMAGIPYYIDKHQAEYLKHMQVVVDVMEGHGASFSLESAEGFAFLMKSKVMG